MPDGSRYCPYSEHISPHGCTSDPLRVPALQSEALTCPVCLGLFDDPVSLPGCGHTFCWRCADHSVLNDVRMRRGDARPSCPVCRAPIAHELRSSTQLQPNRAARAAVAETPLCCGWGVMHSPDCRSWVPDRQLGVPFCCLRMTWREVERLRV